MSILEPGDKFRFRGLRGGAHDHDDNGEYELTIEVLYISMTGQLTFELVTSNSRTSTTTTFRTISQCG